MPAHFGVTYISCMSSRFTIVVLTSTVFSLTAFAQNDSDPVYNSRQSSARPFGLEIVDRVQSRGSDEASARFLNDTLPDLSDFVRSNLQERMMFGHREAISVDPTKLRLTTDAEVRTYFVTEGAGYHNTLGFNVNATGLVDGDPKLIFPDASSRQQFYDPNRAARRTKSYPLLPGDFVDLGSYSAGDQLDFFLIANGARGGTDVFGFDDATNPDGLQHSIAFSYAAEDSPYLVIGFEDLLGGGDQDFNDLVFVVDIGEDNARRLVSAPEPGSLAALGIAGGAAWLRRRRANRSKPTAASAEDESEVTQQGDLV